VYKKKKDLTILLKVLSSIKSIIWKWHPLCYLHGKDWRVWTHICRNILGRHNLNPKASPSISAALILLSLFGRTARL